MTTNILKNKVVIMTTGVLGLVGGLVHVLGAYNWFDLLGVVGGLAPILQLLAGISGVLLATSVLFK